MSQGKQAQKPAKNEGFGVETGELRVTNAE
jgi:hypothetical protein